MPSVEKDTEMFHIWITFKLFSEITIEFQKVFKCDIILLRVLVDYQAIVLAEIVCAYEFSCFEYLLVVIEDLRYVWVSLLYQASLSSFPDITVEVEHNRCCKFVIRSKNFGFVLALVGVLFHL